MTNIFNLMIYNAGHIAEGSPLFQNCVILLKGLTDQSVLWLTFYIGQDPNWIPGMTQEDPSQSAASIVLKFESTEATHFGLVIKERPLLSIIPVFIIHVHDITFFQLYQCTACPCVCKQ